eukprot:5240726-Prymnesium_polylepis.1
MLTRRRAARRARTRRARRWRARRTRCAARPPAARHPALLAASCSHPRHQPPACRHMLTSLRLPRRRAAPKPTDASWPRWRGVSPPRPWATQPQRTRRQRGTPRTARG